MIAGHSQGGHAALFAAALAPKWAPELRLRGVAAFAPASHLGLLSRALPGFTTPSGFSGLAAMVLRGISAAYPQIKPNEIASDQALALLPKVDQVCLGELNSPSLFGGLAPASLIRPGADMSKLNTILDAQNPNLKIAAPILMAQGLSDTTVLPFMTNQLDTELRAGGNKVDLRDLPRRRARGHRGRGGRRRRRSSSPARLK